MSDFDYFPFESGDGAFITEPRWTDMFTWMRTVGVLSEDSTLATDAELAVNPVSPSVGTQVQVEDGEAFIQGFMFIQTNGPEVIDIPLNDSGNDRIDLLVLRLDKENDIIEYVLIEGEPDPSPVPPDPIQNSTIWDLPLAEVYVADEATEIMSGDITDLRVRSMQGDGGSTAVTLTSAGGDETLVAGGNAPPNLQVKELSEGANITLTSDADSVTITGTRVTPMCSVRRNAHASVNNSTTYTISWTTEEQDNANMFDAGDPTRVTITEDGLYLCILRVCWDSNASVTGAVDSVIRAVTSGPTDTPISQSVVMASVNSQLLFTDSVITNLVAGDYLYCTARNTSGQTLNLRTTGIYAPRFYVAKIGTLS